MEEAGDQLREQQYVVRQEETAEPSLYMQVDYIWSRAHQRKKGENPKLSLKYQGPYEMIEVMRYHTYCVQKDGKSSIQHESHIILHIALSQPTKAYHRRKMKKMKQRMKKQHSPLEKY